MKTGFPPDRVLAAGLLGLVFLTSSHALEFEPLNPSRKTYVLVHGAFGGGWAFRQLADLIREAGYEVYRPTLTGLGERVHLASRSIRLETHIQDIVNVIEFEDLRQVILVGHSYAGMVISGVAARIPERLACLVFVDAHVPEDGESMFDLIPEARKQTMLDIARNQGDGWRIPPQWTTPERDVPHPLATLQDPVRIGKLDATILPGCFILTIEPGASQDDFSGSALRARNRGWKVYELPTGHNPHWSMPDQLAEILLKACPP